MIRTQERDELVTAQDTRQPPAGSRRWWVASSVAAVWLSVGAISIWSPDFVSGSQQEHLPLAAFTTWIWAALATGLILLAAGVGERSAGDAWRGIAATIFSIWGVVAVAGIWSPVFVTGTDPTTIPIAALLAPIAGVGATSFVCVYAAGLRAAER